MIKLEKNLTILTSVLTVISVCACAGNKADELKHIEDTRSRVEIEADRIKEDPIAYLTALQQRCEELEQYEMNFYRQERLGLIPALTEMEQIHARFRKHPFSVKFDWFNIDEYDARYFESTYVQDQNDDKLIVRERWGVFPFAPTVRAVDVELPVKVGRAKSMITSFGLARIMARNLEPLTDPLIADRIVFTYEGVVDLQPMNTPAHHLRFERPVEGRWAHAEQHVFVDADTLYPAGTDLRLPNGELDARYRYTDINTDVSFTDADFRLNEGHPEDEPADEQTAK